ncbi:tRNA-(ms[2]io[6]A)-hydroxylase [Cellvibrio japonicus]|uniref:tRNA-(MS[2]IO[6]A)-hydroxylase subfamily n=1 Tax=Cellvibrio japonicus (strain Ueda107) TaxID=498211 RepID=B3PHJ7_CELJU|nr:tRNA isopentenyl-2-thiomethyl-A-37 hydroxylase MiaE [Cellvibrio japonicus]ACE83196.1 tRNA-(MS[2]IO[6]A)-hydroxylase subfamily [Cellvibrio japonicus Ueda107]QEI12473.1 tRNA-(ms[2]io[6]A)-hydroxylase [Cellvibrio japonicus]QEI16047.1 tRNA-(ms[2]io[6]A)-hydroxylase [Cellvibrio japonicus]QEI19625.1 tRNA-(ms[2]io[6]A)-hydroxylase [Cellvibrio japonicus]
MTSLAHIHQFLLCETPDAWIKNALDNQALLLLDHANCEKKAASTALTLMFRYVGDFDMMQKMSRLAREELRHYEQVMDIMEARGVSYDQITPGRYAGELRKLVRTHEPGRYIDTLIVGAIIEARSCERFAKLAPHLDDELQKFYLSLLKSESRHYEDYLKLAKRAAEGKDLSERIQQFLALEKQLIEGTDVEFRFHSGVLAA